MKKSFKYLAVCFLGLIGISCGNTATTAHSQVSGYTPSYVPLPATPAEGFSTPEKRNTYMALHYWDNLDMNDKTTLRDEAFLERNFLRFIEFYLQGDPSSHERAMASMIDKVADDKPAFETLSFIAETYLYSPDSPILADEYYRDFLQAWTQSSKFDDVELMRPRQLLEQANKNLPGTKAADFSYTSREGNKTTLRKTLDGKTLLLIFYEPDCNHCREVFAQLSNDAGFNGDIENGRFSVLAMYAGDNFDLWKEHAAALPANWQVGISPQIEEEDLYIIRATPQMYFIDATGIVLEKDLFPQ